MNTIRLEGIAMPLGLVACVVAMSIAWDSKFTIQDRGDELESDRAKKAGWFALVDVVNGLMLGCTQEGAINWLLEKNGGHIQLVRGALASGITPAPEGYDDVRVLKVGDASKAGSYYSGQLCLYFRNGYLFRKCIIPDGEVVNTNLIFRRELSSGLQHPPSYPVVMERVHWGAPKHPTFVRFPEKGVPIDAQEIIEISEEHQTLVRCGIAFEGLPPYAEQCNYNVLVIYQNVGSKPLQDDICLMVSTPHISVRCQSRGDPGTSRGGLLAFGIYGTRGLHLAAVLDAAHNDMEVEITCRLAPFRLEPGESTFAWFRIKNLEDCSSVQAKVDLMGASIVGLRGWRAESPVVPLPER